MAATFSSRRRGGTVLIVDRGRPVARLEPIGAGPGSDGRLAQLVRDGLARPPRGPLPPDLLEPPPLGTKVEATELLRETAVRCLRLHPLRAADALQLAAAIVAAQGPPSTLDVVTRDERLAAALRREGFRVIGPNL